VMAGDQESGVDESAVSAALVGFVSGRLGASVAVDQDLFRSGLASSMFAMQLVVHLEETYGIAITGADLTLDNFRTVQAMSALVTRLQPALAEADG
ncbi:MAG TPA: phosphopantetheine-binding protein, partial [Streptosporangiaceae bacterium]